DILFNFSLQVSQSFTHGGTRTQIAIPAQGMIEFRDALTDLLDEFGTEEGGFRDTLPEGTNFRVENKKFYFDIGQNKIGVFMRISEVKSSTRSSITIPERSWARFRDIFADYVDKMNPNNSSTSAANTTTTTATSSSGGGGGGGDESGISASEKTTATTTGTKSSSKSQQQQQESSSSSRNNGNTAAATTTTSATSSSSTSAK
uniref:Transcriptional activator protein Pur-beta-like n=1 Tax=Dermatophagoides pteronyssinus TaxID=6956 RepID=A0A6P6XTG8_DERPT